MQGFRAWIYAVSFVGSLLAYMQAPAADDILPSERVTSQVAVRAAPNGNAPVVGALRPTETADYLGDAPHYHHVRLSNGREGYVSKVWTRRVASADRRFGDLAGTLELHFIDVGQGDSTLIVCPNGQIILIDLGSLSRPNIKAIRQYIFQQLDRRARKLDVLVVTHPDQDHYNLIPQILQDVGIAHIYRVGAPDDYSKSFQTWLRNRSSEIVTVLKTNRSEPVESPNAAMECGEADVWIIASSVEAKSSPTNAKSIVLMVRYGDFEAILTGDATHDTEDAILRSYPEDWIRADLLKIGHHGSLATSTSEKWAEAVSPKIAVVSAGYLNGFGHPRKEVLDRLAPYTEDIPGHAMRYAVRMGADYLFTDDQDYREAIYSTSASGNIIVRSNGNGYSLELRPHAR
jgi:beta-lactamase superfamily II metal-dependent hydrolase